MPGFYNHHHIKVLSVLIILIYCQLDSGGDRCCLINGKREQFSLKNRIPLLRSNRRNNHGVNHNPILSNLLKTRAGASSGSSSSVNSRDRLMIMCVSISNGGGGANDENDTFTNVYNNNSNDTIDNGIQIESQIESSQMLNNTTTNGGSRSNSTNKNNTHDETMISVHNETEVTTLSSSKTSKRSLKKFIKRKGRATRVGSKSSSILRESISSLSSLNNNGFNGFNSIHHHPKKIGKKLSMWKNETTVKAKKLFLDKITLASTILLKSEKENEQTQDGNEETEDDKFDDEHDNQITHQSDLLLPGRSFHIVTTAAIPWFTGTAVNPLLRAAYLSKLVKQINQNEEKEIIESNDLTAGTTTVTNMTSSDKQGNNTTSTLGKRRVTLVVPWLELEEDRLELYGEKFNFTNPNEQEQYIRTWLRDQAGMPEEADESDGIQILFYPARYHSGLKSIFAMGDIVSLILDETDDVDVCILEEPEHLNFYRAPGDGWTKKFNFVIGIIHTNYVEYASSHYSGLWTAPAIRVMSSAMVRAYCHVVIKLSDTLQNFAEEKERTSNVHGVRAEFLEEGLRRSNALNDVETETDIKTNKSSVVDAYFIGKLLWTKGLDGILEMQSFYKRYTGDYFEIDIYGNGPDERSIKKAFHGRNQMKQNFVREDESDNVDECIESSESENDTEKYNTITKSKFHNRKEKNGTRRISHHVAKLSKQIQATTQNLKSTTESLDLEFPQSLHEYRRNPIPAKFPGRVDHATLKQYKIFVNPSLSEVLCTTTAEALAMGKFVIIPVHPSNQFFMQFPNCLSYRNKLEFAANLSWAQSHEPEPLTSEQQQLFTWEAATDRLVKASSITRREARERQKLGTSRLDERIAWFHNEIGNGAKGDILRKVLGAGPAAEQVRYTNRQSLDDGDEEKAGGLSMKFIGSSLADALKQTFSNGIFAPAKTLTG